MTPCRTSILRRLKHARALTDGDVVRPELPVGYTRAKRVGAAWEEMLDALIVAIGGAALLWSFAFERAFDRHDALGTLLPLVGVVVFMAAARLALALTGGREQVGSAGRLTLLSLGVAGVIAGFVFDATTGSGDLD